MLFDIGKKEWSELQLEAFGGAEAGTTGAGIAGDFLGGGVDGFAGQEAETVFGVRAGGGPLGAIQLRSGEEVKGVFGDAVFQRVERNDSDAATGLKPTWSILEELLERAEFVVYGDAKSLEDKGGGVPFAAWWRMAGDKIGKFQGACDRMGDSGFCDNVGELPGAVFLTEIAEDPGEFFHAGRIDNIGRGATCGGIHAEVEWAVFLKGETAFRFVELMTGDAKVNEDPIQATDTNLGEDVREVAKVAMEGAELITEGSEAMGGGLQGSVILIHSDHASPELEEGFRMTATTERAI